MKNRYLSGLLCCAVVVGIVAMGAFEAEAQNRVSIARTADGAVDCAHYANYEGRLLKPVADQCGTGQGAVINNPGTRFPTDSGYAQNVYGDELITWTLNDWPGQTVIASPSILDSYAMDFDQTATVLWALTTFDTVNNPPSSLGTVNLATGAFTAVNACAVPGGGASWSGLTVDPVTGTFYASSATALYIIDESDPTNCNPTLVGNFNTGGGLVIDIAMNGLGEMYAHDIGDDSLYTVDTATGATTLVGSTGYNANYAQGMDFDPSDNTLYAFLLTGDPTSYYGTFNLATGAFTAINTNVLSEYEGGVKVAAGDFEPLYCNGPAVQFETGIPEDWTVNTTTGNVYWSTTDDLVACDNGGNQTLGTGEAACADSDQLNQAGNPYDTELWSTYFDLSGGTVIATLQFAGAYNDIGAASGDSFQVWVWDGTTWTMELEWNEDHNEIVNLDLSAYVGLPEVGVSFRYSGTSWDWWAQVDDVSLSCVNPSLNLTKVVDTTVNCPSGQDSITVAPGTDVYYCYTVENTGNVTLTTHDLVDDQLGTLFTGTSQDLPPGATYTYNHPTGVTINATTVNVGTWTSYIPGTPVTASAQDSAEVLVLGPDPLYCGGMPVTFDAGLPPDWTVIDNMGTGVVWLTTGTQGYPIDCLEDNYTGGGGLAACISSDGFGGANYDSELIPPAIDFTGFGAATLSAVITYQDISANGGDRFDIDVSLDGGTNWVNALSWDEDHGTFNAPPGESVLLDLTPYGVGGQASVLLRFHNYSDDLTDPWDWYAIVDNAFVECIVPVDIQSLSVE